VSRRLADGPSADCDRHRDAASVSAGETIAHVEFLSTKESHQFPERLFEIMPEDHFWVRARFDIFLREVRKLGNDLGARKLGLDIGCAHGVVQRQLAAHSAWSADGCDLTVAGLARNSGHAGRVLYYNILDRRLELRERYDFLIMFDVLEHIEDTKSFLSAALFHLKPGGYVFVNVPAMHALHSKFDDVLGHLRRYDRRLLSQHLVDADLDVRSVRYWAFTMIPVIYARGLLVKFFADPDKILRIGFKPPGRSIAAALYRLLALEFQVFQSVPIGACLLAVAQKGR
jgi:2-polyprenyl-3-methyl-5-hydroxy-6-metoxy-1,4-benzoquinol methylase